MKVRLGEEIGVGCRLGRCWAVMESVDVRVESGDRALVCDSERIFRIGSAICSRGGDMIVLCNYDVHRCVRFWHVVSHPDDLRRETAQFPLIPCRAHGTSIKSHNSFDA